MKTRALLLLLPVIGALIWVLFVVLVRTFAPERPAERLTIAAGRVPQNALIFVAQGRGYFRDEGLDVDLQLHTFNKETLDALLAGRADLATPGETPVMLAAMRDDPVAIVATLFSSDRTMGILARRASGISKPADLAGKRIAAPAGSTADYFRYAFLAVHGIPFDSVERIDMPPEEMSAALSAGKVDAVSVGLPHLIACEQKLGREGVMFGDAIYTQTANLTALKPWVAGHKSPINAVLRALKKSEMFISDDPAAARDLVLSYTPMDEATLTELWPNLRFHLELPQFLVITLENQARWAMATGKVELREVPNFLSLFYFDGLRAIAPGRVTIVH